MRTKDELIAFLRQRRQLYADSVEYDGMSLSFSEANPMLRVIVAGDRHLDDYPLVCRCLDHLLVNRLPEVLIVSGGQTGADSLGERYAEEHDLFWIRFRADWSLGKRAGPLRNEAMAQNADAVVIFDGGGPGSRSMRRIAESRGLPTKVVPVEISR